MATKQKSLPWRKMEQMIVEIAAGTSAEESGLVTDDASREAWDALSREAARMRKDGTVMDIPTEFPGDEHDDAIKTLYKDF